MFVRSLCSPALQRYTLLHSVHGLAHSLRSLPRGTVEILEKVFTLLSRFTGGNAFLVVTRNTPCVIENHCISLCLISSHIVLLCLIASHQASSHIRSSQSVSSCLIVSHLISYCLHVFYCKLLCLITSHIVSLCFIASHSVSECLTFTIPAGRIRIKGTMVKIETRQKG